ncbi:MAG TPA: hypothetical protein VGD26_09410, partial [Chitinophagaceae bacterium]
MKKELQVILNPDHIDLETVVGLDLETSGLRAWEHEIKLIIINTSEKTYILDTGKYHPSFLKEVFQNISLCERVVAHNAKFDCGFIYSHYGILLRNWFCTQIASQIVTNGKIEFQGKHSLPEVIERYLGERLQFTDTKKLMQKSFTSQYALDKFTDKQLHYAADDVKYLIPLANVLSKQIDNLTMRAIGKLEMDLLPILAKMEIEGCLIDAENWKKLIHDVWEPELKEIEKRLDKEVRNLNPSYGDRRVQEVVQFDLFGGSRTTRTTDSSAINYGSADQIIQLFKDLGEEVPYIEIDQKEKEDGYIIACRNAGYLDLFDYQEQSVEGENRAPEISPTRGNLLEGSGNQTATKVRKETLEEGVLTTYINERPNSRMRAFIETLLEYRV